jgi:hypothetical protein
VAISKQYRYLVKKTKFSTNYFYKNKWGNSAADSLTKITFSALTLVNNHVPNKVVLIFVKISLAIFFGGSEFSPTLKPVELKYLKYLHLLRF